MLEVNLLITNNVLFFLFRSRLERKIIKAAVQLKDLRWNSFFPQVLSGDLWCRAVAQGPLLLPEILAGSARCVLNGCVLGWSFVLVTSPTVLLMIFKHCKGASQVFCTAELLLWESFSLNTGIIFHLSSRSGHGRGISRFFYAKSGTFSVLESSPVIHGCFFFSQKVNRMKCCFRCTNSLSL